MEPVTVIAGPVSVLDRDDVDTDQIIPKQFLKRIERTGFGEFLFYDWAQGAGLGPARQPDPRRRAATSAAAPRASTRRGRSRTTASRRSSRRRFADIFGSNSTKIGLLPVVLGEDDVQGGRRRRQRRDRPRRAGGPLRRPGRRASRSTRRSSTACSAGSTTSR